ncbi:MAG: saccharopine dehydrogenase NADP-binding domain-containing protein, partial [Candidatus Acidiferrum sp.]
MSYNILLYGATGYSGRLIAAEGKAMGMSRQNARGDCGMILAARDGAPLRAVAEESGMEFRVFGLDGRDEVLRQLDGIDVVINAAGPFAFTAESLLKSALEKRCHYLDINGEVDVYRMLDDFGFIAAQREVAIVSGAGNYAAAS